MKFLLVASVITLLVLALLTGGAVRVTYELFAFVLIVIMKSKHSIEQ